MQTQARRLPPEALKDELSTLEIKDAFPGGEEIILPYDTIKFSESEFNGIPYKNTNMDGKLTIAQFQDGSLVTVWPFDKRIPCITVLLLAIMILGLYPRSRSWFFVSENRVR